MDMKRKIVPVSHGSIYESMGRGFNSKLNTNSKVHFSFIFQCDRNTYVHNELIKGTEAATSPRPHNFQHCELTFMT